MVRDKPCMVTHFYLLKFTNLHSICSNRVPGIFSFLGIFMVKYSWIVNIYICLFTEPDGFQENIPTHVHSNTRKILLQCLPKLVQYIQTEEKSCYNVYQSWSNTFKQKENPATMFTNVGPIHSNRRKILLQCLPMLVPIHSNRGKILLQCLPKLVQYIQTEGKSCYSVYQCWSNTFKQKENPATVFTNVGPNTFKQSENPATRFTNVGPIHSNRGKILLQCLPMLVQYIQTEGKPCYNVYQCWSNTFKQKENPATMFTNVGPIHSNRRKILLQCLPVLAQYIQTAIMFTNVGPIHYYRKKSCNNGYQCWSNTFKQKGNPATMFTNVGPIH